MENHRWKDNRLTNGLHNKDFEARALEFFTFCKHREFMDEIE